MVLLEQQEQGRRRQGRYRSTGPEGRQGIQGLTGATGATGPAGITTLNSTNLYSNTTFGFVLNGQINGTYGYM